MKGKKMKCDKCGKTIDETEVKCGLQVRVLDKLSNFEVTLLFDKVTFHGYDTRQACLCRACLYALYRKFRDVIDMSQNK